MDKMFFSARIQMFELQSIMINSVSFREELRTVFIRRMRTIPTTVLTIYEYILIPLSISNYIYTMFRDI